MAPFHGQLASSPGAAVHLTCGTINVHFLRNEHGFPIAGIPTFPQKLSNTASFGVPQQTWEEKEKRGGGEEQEASERNIHFLFVFD